MNAVYRFLRLPRRHISLLSASVVLVSGPSGGAQEVGPDGGQPPHAEARFASRAPIIDGVWSPGEWDEARPITFAATPSTAGATSGCEVRFLWNAEGVFIGFRASDATPVYGGTKPGETLHREDVFEVFFDQVGDHRQFWELQIAPHGQLYLRNHLLTAPPRLTAEQCLTPEFADRELWRYDVPIPPGLKSATR